MKYRADTSFPSITPNSGNSATGINAVTARGTVSVIHQIAIRRAIPAIKPTCGLAGSGLKKTKNNIAITGPMINPAFFIVAKPEVKNLDFINETGFLISPEP